MDTISLLIEDEGFRPNAYRCTAGYPTIGYGKKLGPRGASLDFYQFTITERVARYWLKEDIADLHVVASGMVPGLDGVRKAALVNMIYQLGPRGVRGFKKMLAAMRNGDWAEAAKEALDSKWARQDTPRRALRIAGIIETGHWP